MQKIVPHLWFAHNAEEAVALYTSIFRDGKIVSTSRYPEAGREIHGMEPGSTMTQEFEIDGQRFAALNAGPHFTFTPAISFMVSRETAQEIDTLWATLAEGGQVLMPLGSYPFSQHYGWVQDRYGVSWQLMLPEAGSEIRQSIIPSLLFVGQNAGRAEDAINFYTSVFDDSEVGMVVHYGPGQEPNAEGTLMFGDFTLAGQLFAAMDSALEHEFGFNEAISLLVNCRDQEEIDYFWDRLSAVPAAEQCGWLKDKYGVSWQIVPRGMDDFLNDPDSAKVNRGMQALLKMKKIDIRAFEDAL
ncbi:MAG TPA: VOC family protein [Longimicrobiaceae bacterium]|nr:VOC family protein [Longimicrobiaceae bacterium]